MFFIFFIGKEIIDYFIKELENEGITEVPAWTEPESIERRQSNVEDSQTSNELVLGASANNLTNGNRSLASPVKKGKNQHKNKSYVFILFFNVVE